MTIIKRGRVSILNAEITKKTTYVLKWDVSQSNVTFMLFYQLSVKVKGKGTDR